MALTVLQEWVRDVLRTIDPDSGDEDAAVNRFELWYHGDDTNERLRIFRTEDRDEGTIAEMPVPIGTELQRSAEQHASTCPHGMSVRYGVKAFRGRDDTVAEATTYIVLMGTMVPNPGNSQASERGQLIRHNETLHTMMMQMVQSMSGRLARDLEEERDARRAAEARTSSIIHMREEMLDRKAERELEIFREQRDAQQKEALLGLVAGMVPTILARLGGPKPQAGEVDQAAVQRDKAVRTIFEKLPADEIQKIVMAVKPETQAVLLQLLDTYSEPDAGNRKPESRPS